MFMPEWDAGHLLYFMRNFFKGIQFGVAILCYILATIALLGTAIRYFKGMDEQNGVQIVVGAAIGFALWGLGKFLKDNANTASDEANF